MKIVCVNCQSEFGIEKSGVPVVETFGEDEPYKVWFADLFKCRGCGFEVVTQFGAKPHKEHFDVGFAQWFEGFKAKAKRIFYDYEKPKVVVQ